MEDTENIYNKKHRMNHLNDREIIDLIKKCYFKLGIKAEASTEEWSNIIGEVKKFQGYVPIDIFEHSFSLLAANETEVKDKPAFSSWFISRVIKAQQSKSMVERKVRSKIEEVVISPDVNWFNTLINILEGTVSESTLKTYPNHKASPPMIPCAWNWNAVYRHLRSELKCDKSDGTDESRKKRVMLWIDVNYHGVQHQNSKFSKSLQGLI